MVRWPVFLSGLSVLLGNLCMVPLAAADMPSHHASMAQTAGPLMSSADAVSCPLAARQHVTVSRHTPSCGKEGQDCLLKNVQREVGLFGTNVIPVSLPGSGRSFLYAASQTVAPSTVTAAGPPRSPFRTVVLRC